MTLRQSRLSRRTFLRGTGVALGLPWLEAMSPLALHAAGPAIRSHRRTNAAIDAKKSGIKDDATEWLVL